MDPVSFYMHLCDDDVSTVFGGSEGEQNWVIVIGGEIRLASKPQLFGRASAIWVGRILISVPPAVSATADPSASKKLAPLYVGNYKLLF